MFARGYFKLDRLPTCVAGSTLLTLALTAGVLSVSSITSFRRQVLALGLPLDLRAPLTAAVDDAFNRPLVSSLILLSSLALIAAIFHAGALPLYHHSSRFRYHNTLQDALAVFGWSLLSLHHVATLLLLAALLVGGHTAAKISPLLLALPASHFLLWILPAVPPALHCEIGVATHVVVHLTLSLLYAWRATVLRVPWELLGTAAELLCLLSIAPEAIGHMAAAKAWDTNVPSRSWRSPWGSESSEDARHASSSGVLNSSGTTTSSTPATSARAGLPSEERTPSRRAGAESEEGGAAPGTALGTARSGGGGLTQRGAATAPAAVPSSGDTIATRVAARRRGPTSSGGTASGQPSTAMAAGGFRVSDLETRTVAAAQEAGGSEGAGPRHSREGPARRLFSVHEPETSEERAVLGSALFTEEAQEQAGGEDQEYEEETDDEHEEGFERWGTGRTGQVQLESALGGVERLRARVAARSHYLATAVQRRSRHMPSYALLILVSMASLFCQGGLIAITSMPPLGRVAAETANAVQFVSLTAMHDAAGLPGAAQQVAAAMAQDAQAALHRAAERSAGAAQTTVDVALDAAYDAIVSGYKAMSDAHRRRHPSDASAASKAEPIGGLKAAGEAALDAVRQAAGQAEQEAQRLVDQVLHPHPHTHE